jgi:hypothetical protein
MHVSSSLLLISFPAQTAVGPPPMSPLPPAGALLCPYNITKRAYQRSRARV